MIMNFVLALLVFTLTASITPPYESVQTTTISDVAADRLPRSPVCVPTTPSSR